MSVSGYFVLTIILAASCFASWKAAIYWNLRTREARDEDPRDQEIRELGAALSIARKELHKTSNAEKASTTQAMELTGKLEHTSAALADTQQKFNATKENLQKDLDKKHVLEEEIAQLRRELEQARTQVDELKLLAKSSTENDLLAETDMLAAKENS